MNENTIKSPTKFSTVWDNFKRIMKYILEEYIKYPLFIIIHPLKGFDYFKRDKRAKMSVAIVFVVILIVLQILQIQYTGFVISQRNINDLNTMREIAYIVVPIFVVVVANWSLTTLFDGKGKMNEIFMMICYSLFPLIITKLIGILFSNVIVTGEVGFYNLILSAGVFLSAYMMFFGFISIHEYGVIKCIGSIIGTGVAVMVILFIFLLGFDLLQKIIGFVVTVYREISLRYL